MPPTQPARPAELTLDLPEGQKLAAMAWGPSSGPRVLGVHGWMDNAATFATLAPLLDGIHLVALDMPGHGRSAHRPPTATYHFIDWVADVARAADALGWERFSLLGHSMGAGVGLLTAGALPERVEGLVMLDGIGPMTTDAAGAPEQLKLAIEKERRHNQKATRGPRVYKTLQEMVARRRLATGLTEQAARVLVERAAVASGGGWRYRHDPRLRGSSRLRLTEEHVEAFARAVRCPLQVIAASSSPTVPKSLVASRLANVRAAAIDEVEGGHHAHLEAPGRVAPLVRAALARGLDPEG